jgi:radical SAM-linked protein
VAFSAGFNPKPQLSFGPPLPLGVESVAEYFDLELKVPLAAAELIFALKQHLPPGLEVLSLHQLESKAPSLMADTISIYYRYTLERKNPISDRRVEEEMAALWANPELMIAKKTKNGEKNVNIRPLWKSYDLVFNAGGKIDFQIEVAFGPQGTIRPDDFGSFLVAAFRIEKIRRTKVRFKGGEKHQKVL